MRSEFVNSALSGSIHSYPNASGTIVSNLAISEPDLSPQPGRDFRNAIHFCIAVTSGCLLFVVSRKLTWGVDEPLLNLWLWTLAIVPYLISVLIAQGLPTEERLSSLLYPTGFVSVWTLSLALYVLVHATGASSLFEDPIYDAFGLNSRAYSILSTLYVIGAYGITNAAVLIRKHLGKDRASSTGMMPSATVMALLSLMCIPLFFALVFFVPLQH